MILFFLFSLLGDNNTLYLMDKSFSLTPIEEEFRFLNSKNGIQTTHGSRNSDQWYEMYRIKIWAVLFSNIVFEYNLENENDYDIKTEEHLFKLRWIGGENSRIPLSFSLFLSPQSSQNKKYIGTGIGYWKNIENNHSLNIILHEFDHNYLISHREPSIHEDSFTKFPVSLELQGLINGNQADLYYRYYKTIKAKKNFLENDEEMGSAEFGGMGLKNIIYYHLFDKFSPGLRLNYRKTDSSYISLPEDTLNYETNIAIFFAEPFIQTEISEKSSFYIGLPMDWKYVKNDSLEYKRKWIGLTLLYNHSFSDYINLTLGIQKSWRNLNGQKNSETRGVLGLNLKLNKETYIALRQGIELDFPLPERLEEYNNHTYLLFNHCF
ncbi:hypothetical protein JW879_04670 [candidate division WOR-3 bacterium]|nr:hypothetical protein [candidate division WOR-3 bacterium]